MEVDLGPKMRTVAPKEKEEYRFAVFKECILLCSQSDKSPDERINIVSAR
jgi:hypothetical protein